MCRGTKVLNVGMIRVPIGGMILLYARFLGDLKCLSVCCVLRDVYVRLLWMINEPAKQTFELFDNICLMAEGRIIYHGEREGVVPYFNSLG